MNVYAASDLHGNLPSVPSDADVLLLAGDICPDFRGRGGQHLERSGVMQAAWLSDSFSDWLESHGVPTVMTWGNHDFVGQEFREVALPGSATLLVDSEATVEGLRVYGTPWVPGLPYWAFYGRQEALQARAEAIPEGLDVLMSHGPPFEAGDFIPTNEKQRTKYGNFHGKHVGDETLNAAIVRARPKVTICGHIHESRGSHEVDGSAVYNVAAVDGCYYLHPQPFTRLYEF